MLRDGRVPLVRIVWVAGLWHKVARGTQEVGFQVLEMIQMKVLWVQLLALVMNLLLVWTANGVVAHQHVMNMVAAYLRGLVQAWAEVVLDCFERGQAVPEPDFV